MDAHETYEKLYNDILAYQENTGLVTCFPCRGNEYESSSKRLMVIGRCLNGWELNDKFSGKIDRAVVKDDYCEMAQNVWASKNEKDKDGKGRLDFIPVQTRSRFWKTAESVYQKLKSNNTDVKVEGTPWYEHIAWYNLFPIAPSEGGNPSDLLLAIQRKTAKELLEYVLTKLEPRPTHVLFETGWTGWMTYSHAKQEAIEAILQDKEWDLKDYWSARDKDKNNFPCMLDWMHHYMEQCNEEAMQKEKNGDLVLWSGKLDDHVKIVVAKRPEGHAVETYAEEVYQAFNNLK